MATPQPGYLLGVDLGTSNTVAVVRGPDGRTRPLLVDGSPVMPSAVFADESGHIHVGRDAQRLALTDPSRYEPNPKQRSDETAILLGDREVPTVALLTAILRAVADKAVEAIGFLPPAVLTHPARWPSARREKLRRAAADAGFPPVRLLPEPIAAAHYFAEVMNRPIPPGGAVAVFDFGGGTLDIAAVGNDGTGGLTVLGDGGLGDLGGLDVDDALVAHLGRTIDHNAPDLWQRLLHPRTVTDRRGRRQFWEDVRGAKEMLSRTTVAPVPVPGVDHSLHLTRDELERLATPLFERAIAETRRVLAAAHLEPARLHGLFLVGGASRIPLIGRLLHQRLGIAPTVLEQPEIPVAEGALAAVPAERPHEPTTVPAAAGAPVNPVTPAGPHPPAPGAALGGPPGPVSPAAAPPGTPPHDFLPPTVTTTWWRKKTSWIAAAAAVLVVAIGVWLLLRPAYPQRPMNPLAQVGATVPFEGELYSSATDVDIEDGVAYYAVALKNDLNAVTAVRLETGEKLWTNATLASDNGIAGVWAENGVLVLHAATISDPSKWYFLDAETGTTKKVLDGGSGDAYYVVDDTFVRYDSQAAQIVGYDPGGAQKWVAPATGGPGEFSDWEVYEEPVNTTVEEPGLLYTIDGTAGTVTVVDAGTGEQVVSKPVQLSADPATRGYAGHVFVAGGDNGYTLTMYDARTLASQATVQFNGAGRQPDRITPCGETRVCVFEKSGRITLVDFADGLADVKQTPEGTVYTDAVPIGNGLALSWHNENDDAFTTIVDEDLEKINTDHLGSYHRLDSGSLMSYPTFEAMASLTTITGLGGRDGAETALGAIPAASCDADETYLACVTDTGYAVWRFRD